MLEKYKKWKESIIQALEDAICSRPDITGGQIIKENIGKKIRMYMHIY